MKCASCGNPIIVFTVMPDIDFEIGWASHVLLENNGIMKLYHYQCGNVDVSSIYNMLLEYVQEKITSINS